VKWVDEVITDAPYAINEEFMNKLFTEHNVDYIIHGDDPCLLPDGSDAYAHAKKAGRYKQIKRTEGVSSTDIVGNAFFCTLSIARVSMPYSRNRSLLLACYCFSICTEAVWKDGWMDGSLPFVLQMFYSSIVELRMWTSSSSSSQHERDVFLHVCIFSLHC